MADLSKDTHARMYVYIPHKKECFEEAEVINYNEDRLEYTVKNSSGKESILPVDDCLASPIFGAEGEKDMVALEHLNEASILFNLRIRFFSQRIYTYTGAILMSVNPYKTLPIYNNTVRRDYEGRELGALPPHIYAIADTAYRSMLTNGKHQSILISGESGAGKTEAAKLMLEYIADITERQNHERFKGSVKKATAHQQVLATNPILEAFGNAKTVRNDNSSRFGKMIDIQFDNSGFLIGASIKQYLLEQTRLVRQGPKERNFHAFYYLCAGADKTERNLFAISEAKEYFYTNQSGVFNLENVDSMKEYNALKRAMYTAGFSSAEVHNIFKLLAAILWLGNCEFTPHPDVEDGAQFKNEDVVNWVAYLLEVDVDDLKYALLLKETVIRGEVITETLSPEMCTIQRDTLAKQLYLKNFEWIVRRINENTDNKKASSHSMFMLDIFGFEEFEKNYFEQFCINYANERLQHEFNEHIFRLEQEVYRHEGIDVSSFTYQNNLDTINLIEKKPGGIVHLLDEEARMPKASDQTCHQKLCQKHGNHKSFTMPRFNKNAIIISHYAGKVEYNTDGFLYGTKQTFSAQVAALIKASECSQFCDLFSSITLENMTGRHLKTVAVEFKNALSKLMKDLNKTAPHYIRCVKPNENKSATEFNNASVLRQLRCSGVLETIRIRRGGFPNRRVHDDFLERYGVLQKDLVREGSPKQQIHDLCFALKIDKEQYRIGHTQVFLKDSVFHVLEGKRNKLFSDNATTVQKYFRAFLAQRRYKKNKSAAYTMVRWLKEYLVTADPTERVKELMETIKTGSQAEVTKAVEEIEALALRDKNVDIICDLGAVKCLVAAGQRFESSDKVKFHTTRAMTKLSNNQENATKVARMGGVRRMVSNIEQSKLGQKAATETKEESINLLNRIASHRTAVSTVIKENAVRTFKQTLNQKGESKKGKIKELTMKAMGTLTKNERVARAIGRDDEAITTVIKSMNNRIKFGRLCTYSLNCLGNLVQNRYNCESVVEFGGIDVARKVMKQHLGNPSIIKESSRLLCRLGDTPQFAELITESGILELSLDYCMRDPGQCTVPALDIINKTLENDPNAIERLLEAGCIDQLLEILGQGDLGEDVSQAIVHTLTKMAHMSEKAAELLANSGGPARIVDALRRNHGNAQLAKDAIKALGIMSGIDPSILDYIRSEEIVQIICKAMEANPEDRDLIHLGTDALKLFAVEDDLHLAMELIARSRMEDQSYEKQLAAEAAIGIVGNLALIDKHIKYIVDEGGIPILMSIIGGKINKATTDKHAAEVLASATRAVGRLLVKADHCKEFFDQGGFETMKTILEKNDNSDLVMNAVVDLIQNASNTKEGQDMVKASGVLATAIAALRRNPNYKVMATKLVDVIKTIQFDEEEMRELLDAGLVDAIGAVIEHCAKFDTGTAGVLVDFLTDLMENHDSSANVVHACPAPFIALLNHNVENKEVVQKVFKALRTMVDKNADSVDALKKAGLEQALLNVVDKNKVGDKLRKDASNLLTYIVEGEEVGDAVEKARGLAVKVMDEPSNQDLLVQLSKKLAFLANVAGSEARYRDIVEAGGLEQLAQYIAALRTSHTSLAHEQALKDASYMGFKLAQKAGASTIVENGTFQMLVEALNENPAYEDLSVNVVRLILEALDQDAELAQAMIDLGAIDALNCVIEHQPLNEKLTVMASEALARFAEVNGTAVVEAGSIDGLLMGLNRLIGTDDSDLLVRAIKSTLITAQACGTGEFTKADDILDIMDVLKQQASPEVIAMGSQLISCLLGDPEFAAHFMSDGGLPLLGENIIKFADQPNILLPTFEALTKCAAMENVDVHFTDVNLLDGILGSMRVLPDNEAVQISAMGCLTALVDLKDEDMVKSIVDPSCMSLIMNNLHNFHDSIEVVGMAADLITAMAGPDFPMLGQQLLDQGFADALRVHLENAPITTNVQAALTRLDPNVDNLFVALSSEIKAPESVLATLTAIRNKLELGAMEEFDFKHAIGALSSVLNLHSANDPIVDMVCDILGAIVANPDMAIAMIENPDFVTQVVGLLSGNQDCEEVTKILAALLDLTKTSGGAELLIELGTPDLVMKSMQLNVGDSSVVMNGLRVLRELCIDEETVIQLLEGGALDRIQEALANNPDDPQMALEALRLLDRMAHYDKGLEYMKDLGAAELIADLQKRFPQNPLIQGLCEDLLEVLNPKAASPDVEEAERPVKLKEAPSKSYSLADFERSEIDIDTMVLPELPEDENNILERSLGIAVDNNADVFSRLQALRQLENLVLTEEQIDALSSPGEIIRKLVGALNRCTNNPKLLAKLIAALDKIAVNDECFQHIVANGGIGALLKALRDNMDNVGILCNGIALLGSLARNDHLKTLIGLQSAIQLILKCMIRHSYHAHLQDKGCICLANLSYNNPSNTNLIVEKSGVGVIVKAMRTHISEALVQESAMDLLSNLCFNNDNNKVLICRAGGSDTIINAINVHVTEYKMLESAFRALGNLSYYQPNIPILVKQGVPAALLNAIRQSMDQEQLLRIGISVLSNIVADAEQGRKIIQDGVLRTVIEISGRFQESRDMQLAVTGCIGHLSNKIENIKLIIDHRSHFVIHNIFRKLHWDEELMTLCFKLLKRFSMVHENATILVKDKTPHEVIEVLRKNKEKKNLVRLGCLTLTKLIMSEEISRMVTQQGVIDGMVELCKIHFNEPMVMTDIMKVFINLCPVESSAISIAKKASIPILRAVEANSHNQIFLNISATLLGNIAIHGPASRQLTKRGACAVIVETVRRNMEYRSVVTKLIRAMSNLLLTDQGAIQKFQDLSAKELVREVASQHVAHQQLQKAARSFVKAYRQRTENTGPVAHSTQMARDKLPMHAVALLTAGTVMRKFSESGGPRKRRVKTEDNCEIVIFEDTKNRKAPKQLNARAMVKIIKGPCTAPLRRQMRMHRPADPDRCFAILCKDGNDQKYSIDLEAKTKDECDQWVSALSDLVRILKPRKIRGSLLYH